MTERMIPVPESVVNALREAREGGYYEEDNRWDPVDNWLAATKTETGKPVELPMCGDALNTGSYTHECVENQGHVGPHQAITGVWWSR